MAEAPASSMRRTLSMLSESGVDETTIGPLSFKPRYCVEKSIIPHLRQPQPPLSQSYLQASPAGAMCGVSPRPGIAARAE